MSNENSELEIEQPDSGSTDADSIPVAKSIEKHLEEIAEDIAGQENTSSNDEIDALKEQLAEAEKQALLHQADLENFRRRKSRESQEQIRYASMPLIFALLEVVDNLERALQSAANEENASSLREGVEIVFAQLLATLALHGCEKIEAVGQIFDPNLHEAIQMQPADEALNTIIMEIQTGFKLHDRVVRPAKVIISTGPAKKK